VKKIIIHFTTIVVLNTLFASKALGQSNTAPPSLSSEAAIVIDSKTGTVLYGKSSEKMYPVSLTKIATAIYAIETGNIEETVTASKKARNTEGTRVYLEEGEKARLDAENYIIFNKLSFWGIHWFLMRI